MTDSYSFTDQEFTIPAEEVTPFMLNYKRDDTEWFKLNLATGESRKLTEAEIEQLARSLNIGES